jgi:hypothetical protein
MPRRAMGLGRSSSSFVSAACFTASVVSYTIARRSLLVYCSAHDSYTSSPEGASRLAYSRLSDQ